MVEFLALVFLFLSFNHNFESKDFKMEPVQIIEYTPELQPHFERINKQWVEHYFYLEPIDLLQLENPKETILDKGGAILFAKEGESIDSSFEQN